MLSPRLELKIFLSSPGDVTDERGLARRVLNRLSQEYDLRDRVHVEEVSWDDPGAPVPLDAHLTPQEAINNRRPKPSECDIAVVILWSRMGTPLPPEHWKPDGTPYVSGTEYEFCEAVDAAKQTSKPTVLVYRRTEEPRVGLDDPEHDEKAQQYKAVKAFFANFKNTDGSLRRSYKTYRLPSEFEDLLQRELRELIYVQLDALPKEAPATARDYAVPTGHALEPTNKPAWKGNPYLGLKAFREKDAAIFFGRGRETDELIKRFATPTTRIVAVTGASGSGKSSLVGAGLIPRLHNGAFPGSADWVSVRFTPAERGSDPFVNLTRKLAAQLPDASESPEALADRLRTHPTELKELVQRALEGKPRNAELLLFADQFEELFTVRVEERHRQPFIGLIDAIASSPRIRLVLTLRDDYYENCARDPRLAALLRDASFPIAAPTPLALDEMIERPAEVAGLDLEPSLASAILKEAGIEPGALALVEFALEELYERSGGKPLTVAAYRALGGIGGVIESQAEKAVQDADEGALAKIFRQLAAADEKGGAVRKRARLDAFADREQALLNRLVDGRLLVANKDDANVPWVEVAHEAVLRHWRRFSDWVSRWLSWDEDDEALLKDWRQRMAAASEAHYKIASSLRWNNRHLGVPLVILTSIVGTSLFATLADPNAIIDPALKIAIGSISVAAPILAAVQTFLRFGERAEKHVVAADWYAALRRDIDQLLALSPKERGTPKNCFDRIRKKMTNIGQQSPAIGDRLWKVMAEKYGVGHPLTTGALITEIEDQE